MNPVQIVAPLLSNLPLPSKLIRDIKSREITALKAGIQDLPFPLNTASLWLYCDEAWPHSDADFEGLMFINLAIQADHVYNQAAPGDCYESIIVTPGSLYPTNPLALHWLQPSGSIGYVGLQWEVPFADFERAFEQLRHDLEIMGNQFRTSVELNFAITKPASEYVGPAPGFPLLGKYAS
ncbi:MULTISPECIES: hypothetical protein [Pseudomonas]|uniref:Uncharacterized protein n=1 Tax=Pseudomonas fluorescens TaxID=294 RepID=A0A166QM00_PSEFL|nr:MULTISPECIES: hypothetical protein [Pseudomonas]KZN20494.1 hypothetical protein A1D17_02840 [Pseudomonas fluorescens]